MPLVLHCAQLDAPEGKEALVIEESPVERDENVKWKNVLQPRASLRGRNKEEQEREEDKKKVEGVQCVAEGLGGEADGRRGLEIWI